MAVTLRRWPGPVPTLSTAEIIQWNSRRQEHCKLVVDRCGRSRERVVGPQRVAGSTTAGAESILSKIRNRLGRLVRFRKLNEQRFQLSVVSVLIFNRRFAITKLNHCLLKVVSQSSRCRRKLSFRIASNQMELVSQPTVGRGTALYLLDESYAAEKVSSNSKPVRIVVE